MQELPTELPIRNAVDRIADDGKIDRLQVHSDLVRPPGFEPYCKQRVTREEPLDFEVGDRILRSIGFQRPPRGFVAVPADRRLDPAGARTWAPADECEVTALEEAFADKVLESFVGLLRTREDQQSGGVAVESMDDSRPFGQLSSGDAPREQGVHERAARMARRGMHDEPGRLVHDQQMLVFVGDPQVALLGLERDGLRLRRVDLERLAAGQPVALGSRLAVDPNAAGREQALGLGTRRNFGQRGDESVEPLAGSVGWHLEDYRERMSPSRIAAKRMLTPTTMKVSARLNAGQ